MSLSVHQSTGYSTPNTIAKQQQLSFGSCVLVQVPKTAFKSPEDLKAVQRAFTKASDKITGDLSTTVNTILSYLSLSRLIKTGNRVVNFLESPFHTDIEKYCKNHQVPNSYWFGVRSGIPVPQAIDRDYHTFYVATNEHKDKYIDLSFDKEHNKKIVQHTKPFDPRSTSISDYAAQIWIETKVRIGNALMKALGKPERTFKINDLSELSEVYKQLGVAK